MTVALLRATVRSIAEALACGQYESTVAGISSSRLSAKELQDVIRDYGRTLVAPPGTAYEELDAIQVKDAAVPTWSVRAPVWTAEEGRSDLTLELTISFDGDRTNVELDDLHVL